MVKYYNLATWPVCVDTILCSACALGEVFPRANLRNHGNFLYIKGLYYPVVQGLEKTIDYLRIPILITQPI